MFYTSPSETGNNLLCSSSPENWQYNRIIYLFKNLVAELLQRLCGKFYRDVRSIDGDQYDILTAGILNVVKKNTIRLI